MLAFAVALDAQEQDISRYMRHHFLPWFVPRISLQHKRESLDQMFKLLLLFGLKCVDVCFRRLAPALLPCAMTMLLVTTGTSSSELVLNGLSVGFVYELDNMIAQMVLSSQEEAEVKRFFTEVCDGGLWSNSAARDLGCTLTCCPS